MTIEKSANAVNTRSGAFSSYQKFVVAMLAFLQFTIVLDFMVLAPLGAIVIPTLKITPSQFGLIVSAYAFSAGLSGLLTAGFADRFDRKKLLLRLLAAGHAAIEEEEADRLCAVEETAGALSGVYEPGELERLREDWPE